MTATYPTSIKNQNQRLGPGALIQLFQLDLNPVGVNTTFAFTPSGVGITFQGVVYTAVDCEAEGWEYNGKGALPQPRFRIANSTRLLMGAALAYNDLIGAKLTRIRTYAQFLDGMPQADPSAAFAADIYQFQQKTKADKSQVEWAMSAAIDQDGRQLPRRTILRDICSWRYRTYNTTTGQFDYSHATCPYTGSAYFDENGNSTDAAHDVCSKQVTTGCKKRFGTNAALPYGGFPGVARVRL